MKGYIEYVTKNKIGFITNLFGRILYVNPNWPDDGYERFRASNKIITREVKKRAKECRRFNKEELMIELL
jgi:hypothetical protein